MYRVSCKYFSQLKFFQDDNAWVSVSMQGWVPAHRVAMDTSLLSLRAKVPWQPLRHWFPSSSIQVMSLIHSSLGPWPCQDQVHFCTVISTARRIWKHYLPHPHKNVSTIKLLLMYSSYQLSSDLTKNNFCPVVAPDLFILCQWISSESFCYSRLAH